MKIECIGMGGMIVLVAEASRSKQMKLVSDAGTG